MTIEQLIEHIKNSQQHKYLYHFTDESNLSSIDRLGLASKSIMRAEGWWPQTTGGNQLSHDLDDHYGISPYVSLCCTRNHPMKYLANQDGRLPNPRYLAIKPDILRLPGVRVAFGVANASDTQILDLNAAIAQIDIEVLYSRTDWSDGAVQTRLKAAEKMEVLIPDRVPRDMIAGAY